MRTDISVMHIVAGLHPKAGGPSRTVVRLVDGLALESGMALTLLSQSLVGQATVQSTVTSVERRISSTTSHTLVALGLPLRRDLKALLGSRRPKIIHNHGLWLPVNFWAAQMARREKIPFIIHPRGMLESWSLSHRPWKKHLALRLHQRRDLEAATLFFATAEQEAESIRRLGLRQPIAVIPNGVDITIPPSNKARQKRTSENIRTALFLSRIHPKKGLLNLVEAWGRIHSSDWRLYVAGPNEGGHLEEVMRKIRALGLETTVEYVGEVEGNTKQALFENADLFVLPSFSENFGVAVAEAMAHGVPVITTHGTPWEGLLRRGCGWWIEPTVDALSQALSEAMTMDRASLQSMGEKGREYAGEFDWSSIALQTVEVYRWVLGQRSKPACVLED